MHRYPKPKDCTCTPADDFSDAHAIGCPTTRRRMEKRGADHAHRQHICDDECDDDHITQIQMATPFHHILPKAHA